ncbi:MAG: VOC family protein [Alphaproteobacteria bacterium]|nr:VOC family protein [Alphaproteobacteria bacterium]
MIHALDHIVLAVDDLDAAVATYETALGRRCDARASGGGATYAWFRLANMALAVATRTGAGPTGELIASRLGAAGPGLAALAFAVADLPKAGALVERRGLPARAPIPLPAARRDATATPDTALAIATEATHGVPVLLVERPNAAAAQGSTPGDAGAISGLDHVVVRSPNPERAVALYGGRLGLSLRLDRANPAWDARLLFFRCGDLVVEIAHGLKAGVSDAPDELWGLSWRVPDVEAAHARLSTAGIAVSETRTGRRPGSRVFTIRDRALCVPTLVLGLTA